MSERENHSKESTTKRGNKNVFLKCSGLEKWICFEIKHLNRDVFERLGKSTISPLENQGE